MDLPGHVARLIQPTVESMGFDIVRVRISGRQRPRLQVIAERRDGKAIMVDDCAAISRAISALLDVEDPIHGSYILEVSSPGIDRPLVRREDYQRFTGYEARIEMSCSIGNRRKFKGRLLGIEGDTVRIRVDGRSVDLPYGDILRAKLLLTDDLLAAAKGSQKQ